ncbi:MAG: nitrogen regulation protein NR(II) [Pseudomonadales bacterium]
MVSHSQLLDNLTTSVLVVDSDLRIVWLNSAAEVLLQTSGQRVKGDSLAALFDGRLAAKLGTAQAPLQGLAEALTDGSSYRKRHASLLLATGRQIAVDYAITPFVQDGRSLLLVELQSVDRLLRISREETLLSSQHTTRNLLRGLAHEIKNPLGGLRGAAQLLERQLPDTELKDYTRVIIDEADRLRKLVDRMLGPHKINPVKLLNIHEVLERVCALVDAESNSSIHIERDYDPSIPDLTGDAEQLIQAVLNIMRNAMQSLQSQPDNHAATITLRSRIQRHFTIGTRQHRLLAQIVIADNGPGIADELIDTIFFPLISGRANGSGLGLSIAQSIIHQHQGLIQCNSEPGNTQFTIYLPLAPSVPSRD